MKKRSKKIVLIVIGILLGVTGILTIFFNIPYSKTKTEFKEINSIKKPTLFKAIWHYDDGDLIYFNGKGTIMDR